VPAVARVEPLVTTRQVRGPFDYRLDGLDGDVGVGSRLEIPFSGRTVTGVVTGLAADSELPAERLSAPHRLLAPAIPADLVALALWLAAEYCSTPARALALVAPPPGRPAHVLVAQRTRAPATGRLTDRQRAALAALEAGPRAAAELGHDTARRLEARGLLTLRPAPRPRRPAASGLAGLARPAALTAEQAAALAELEPGVRLLLHGVTGSGKTEVYLRAAEAALAAGRSVIVLVPEIALTPQTVARFAGRLGDTVAVLHSGLGEGERFDEWSRLARGEARVCVGPRSAVFAPVRDLGLIVVDEEHEPSYKHEGDPRYDARRVAEERAGRSDATLLAGSATPRPESVHGLRRVRLDARVDGRPLPPVEIVDMREAASALHPTTRAALAEGGKAIVLLNRRGWSNFLSCRSCGKVWECPSCDVALVLHRAAGVLACHHCGHRERVPTRCDACGSVSVARHGAGTERIESELAAAFDAPVLRLDAGVPPGPVLAAFAAAPTGILVGTQVVAKGHDFPDVTLGVVLDADSTLRFPDFRAEERTFGLVAQLAGRAGRGPAGGRVLVQTTTPDAPAIRLAAHHDADGFLELELARREVLRYPPFATLIRVVCSAPQLSTATAAAEALRTRLDPPGADVLGPAPLFRLRRRERVQLVLKAGDREGAIAAVREATDAVARTREGRGAALSVDVDPQ
jgi:primosomal protein N' (replication factor Y) (superfamily II helicase)